MLLKMVAFGAVTPIDGCPDDGAWAAFCLATRSALGSIVRNGRTVWPRGECCFNGFRTAGRAVPAGATAFCRLVGFANDGIDVVGIDVGAALTTAWDAMMSPVASAAARRARLRRRCDCSLRKRRAPNGYPLTQHRFTPAPRPWPEL